MFIRKGRLQKVYFLTAFITAFIMMPAVCFAQDLPCGGDDPYGNCPLDSNVWLMAAIGLIAGAWMIFKQQNLAQRKTK